MVGTGCCNFLGKNYIFCESTERKLGNNPKTNINKGSGKCKTNISSFKQNKHEKT